MISCANGFRSPPPLPLSTRVAEEPGFRVLDKLAQELFQRHLLQRTPSDYHKTRGMLSVYYQGLLEEIERDEGMEAIATPDWLELKLALALQLFLCEGDRTDC